MANKYINAQCTQSIKKYMYKSKYDKYTKLQNGQKMSVHVGDDLGNFIFHRNTKQNINSETQEFFSVSYQT